MKEKACCFTGHRKIPPEQLFEITRRIKDKINDLISNGYICFLTGGALGFDTIAAEAIIEYKNVNPDIQLILALPCQTQAEKWLDKDKARYELIKKKADRVLYISDEYTRGCMFKRNRYLVDNGSVCICYLKDNTGGTAYTVKYAENKMLEVINIAKEEQNESKKI